MLYGLARLHAELLQHAAHRRRRENAHERVVERQIEARCTRVTLTAGAAAQLVVDAARFVALAAHHIEAAGGFHRIVALLPFGLRAGAGGGIVFGKLVQLGFERAAEHDVGAASGHIGGDGDIAGAAGVGNDLSLALVLLGVEHFMDNVLVLEHRTQQLGRLDARGAHQHRLAALVGDDDLGHHRVELLRLGDEHLVALVVTDHIAIGGNHHHFEVVNILELEGFGVGRAGHARELFVEAEIVLEGDAGESLVFLLDLDALLGFHRLVQAIAPAPPRHKPAGELVHDDHLPAAHDVFDIALVEVVGSEQRTEVVEQHDIGRLVERSVFAQQAGITQRALGVFVAGFGEVDLLGLFIGPEITSALLFLLRNELGDDGVDLGPELGVVVGRAADDERRAGLVDEDGVHLVDDCVVLAALDFLFERESHVVAQIVEAEFVVGAVGDVAGVGGVLFVLVLAGDDDAHGEAEEFVDATHPLGVALGEVVVHCNDVNTLAFERVQISGERGDQGLAFTCAHFSDLAGVQHRATDQLHIEVTHAERALAGFTADGEGIGSDVVELLAFSEPALEHLGLLLQLGVGEGGILRLQHADLIDHLLFERGDKPLVTAPEDACQQSVDHGVRYENAP